MAQKIDPPLRPGIGPRRRAWQAAVLVLALAAAAVGARFWQQHARIARIQAAVPAAPTSAPNATLRQLLTEAETRARATGEPAAVAELGRLCHANGFTREAEACWRLLIREQPGEARWHYYLSNLLRTAGDQTGAEEQLELTVATDPTAAIAWLQLAEMKFKSGRADAAGADYRRRLALVPDDPYAGLGLARLAQAQGRTDDTLGQLERIVQKHPQFSAAHNLYAELQAAAGREDLADLHRWLGREAGRFREADDPWMEELNAHCHETKRLCHLGVIAYQTKQGDLGRSRFEHAIALDAGDPLSYQLLGELLLEQGATAEARDLLARGIAQAQSVPPTSTHFLKLVEATGKLGREEEARTALREGLARHDSSGELHHAHGAMLRAEGRTAEAEAAYRRAIARNPGHVESHFALALIQLDQRKRDDAFATLQQALQRQPTFPKALLLLGRLELDAGRTEAAGGYLQPLLKHNPGVPDIRQIVARWHLQAGREAEQRAPATTAAERHYREGLKLHPENPELNAGLGVLLLLADRVGESVPWLETYHRLQPASPPSALFLGQAYARTGRLADARRVLTAGLQQAEQAGQAGSARNFREILAMLPP